MSCAPTCRRMAHYSLRSSALPLPVCDRVSKTDTWIAISRPPYFTALALWWVCGTSCTGGISPIVGVSGSAGRMARIGDVCRINVGDCPLVQAGKLPLAI